MTGPGASSADPMADIRIAFFEECSEHLEQVQDTLARIGSGAGDPECVHALFRAAHSIKGGAAAFGMSGLVDFSHDLESRLSPLREAPVATLITITGQLERAFDRLADHVSRAKIGATPSEEDRLSDAALLSQIDLVDGTELSLTMTPKATALTTAQDPRDVLDALHDLGTVTARIDTSNLPDLAQLDPATCHLRWDIMLETTEPAAAIDAYVAALPDDLGVTLTSPAPDAAAPTRAPDAKPSVAAPSAPMPTIRVSIDRVDRLMNLVGELVITQSMLVQSGTAAGLVTHSPHASGIEELGRLSRDLQDSVMQIRAQPVKPLFQRMARISREVADATGKDIRFDMEGSETEVDTTVIERLSEPLTHMIRNAIDHGIEAAEVRRGTGKPDQGRLTLSAAQRSGRILIKLSDDGGGIDRAAVRARAIDRGIVGADDDLAPEAIDMLLFEPGFSTAQTVTELSGRGVGLDVVREAIRSLGGRISVDSASGTGTTWIISLPLTLAVVDGMVLQVADQTIVMPLAAIRETLAPRAADIMTWDGGMTVMRHHRSVLPLHNLAEILGYAAHRPVTPDQVALIIDDGDAPACAIVVDEIEDQRQVVIKALQDGVPLPPCISAATILGDGRVALIVDPLLVGETQMRRGAAPPPPHSALPGACPGAHVAAAPP